MTATPSSPVTDTSQLTPRKTVSDYMAAAKVEDYRMPDAPLFTCPAHGAAAVLCITSGKTGRSGTSATIGATPFWLTCPFINNFIGHVERAGGVQSVARFLEQSTTAMEEHCASHATFERRVEELLPPHQFAFFQTHFMTEDVADSLAASSSHGASARRKFGNAAVNHAEDMKCLHALVAQELCGATNPIGLAIANYIVFVHGLLPTVKAVAPDGGEPLTTMEQFGMTKEEVDALRHALSHASLLEYFLRVCSDESGRLGLASSSALPPAPPSEWPTGRPGPGLGHWHGAKELSELDLCQRCYDIVVFVDGKAPRTQKKRRRN